MKNQLSKLLSITLIILLGSCDKPSRDLKPGIWRAALITESGAEIPFNFQLTDSASKFHIEIINGDNRLRVDEVEQRGDSVFIKLPFFDSELKGVLSDDKIEGVWIKHLADREVTMSFYAVHNVTWRIKEKTEKPLYNIDGKWETKFVNPQTKDSSLAIGVFKQQGAKVTGTFITKTGDYRFLEGVLDGENLTLSTFDGGFALLFTAKVNKDSTLTDGKYYSGFSGLRSFSAKKNNEVELEDAYSLTYLKEGYDRIDFSFPDLNKNIVSLADERFKNKVVIIQILGSWCPNCIDETAYLTSYQKENNFNDVEIVALAYERTADFEKSKKNLERITKRFDVQYPVLVTGYTIEKGEPAKSLPMLNHVMAFPTTIILDKKGKVRKIHTGFSGPGTGKYFEEYKAGFEKLINDLRTE
jgi:thiol-disulfide isomerase/thioredoxin